MSHLPSAHDHYRFAQQPSQTFFLDSADKRRTATETNPSMSMTQHALAHVYGGRAGMFCIWRRFDRHANAWLTRDIRVAVPQSARFNLHGMLRPGVTAKDVMLHLLSQPFWRVSVSLGVTQAPSNVLRGLLAKGNGP